MAPSNYDRGVGRRWVENNIIIGSLLLFIRILNTYWYVHDAVIISKIGFDYLNSCVMRHSL